MSYRRIEDWDVDEVCAFLDAIGLGDKVGPFRDETVDGALLLDLEQTELIDDLHLTKSECDKVRRCLEFARKIVDAKAKSDESEDLRERVNMLELRVSDLECLLEEKDGKIRELEAATTAPAASEPISVYVPPPQAEAEASSPPQASDAAAAPAPGPAPAPAPSNPPAKAAPPPPPKKEQEKPKVKAQPEKEKPKVKAAQPEKAKPKKEEPKKTVGGLRGVRERRKKEGKKVLFGGPGKGWLS